MYLTLRGVKLIKLFNDLVIKEYLYAGVRERATDHYMRISANTADKILNMERITFDEGITLYQEAPLSELMFFADMIRHRIHPDNEAGWIIDRNVNITNICFSQCRFCNFCRNRNDHDAFVTTDEEYDQKIRELVALDGDQLLLQGGMNPALGLDFYIRLFKRLKDRWPSLKLHALGPPEIVFLANKENTSYREVLEKLIDSGLDSLPGAGAEILSDRVRKIVSPAKASTNEWLSVMREAHILNLPTSATMMYGHAETPAERIEHMILLRELQDEKPDGSYGFITFIPWPFMDRGTMLAEKFNIRNNTSAADYIRVIALSRIMLDNIMNIQSSILTVGRDTAMITLHGGANDLGSVMIEENVVSAAGNAFRCGPDEMQEIIRDAGFIPARRNQKYEKI